MVRIYGDDGREAPIGATGRIFVGNQFQFEGYTGGGGKEEIDGLLASGDVGHFDAEGRLFVDGRDDEMIVSGGENVYPREVEDLLAGHPKVGEVAVVGVPDKEFGQALKAVIVAKGGLSASEVRDYVRSNLARYKVPRQVEFVKELPRNPTGKVLKRELARANGRRRRTKAS
jgi:fatty-acyl-CoA synthase